MSEGTLAGTRGEREEFLLRAQELTPIVGVETEWGTFVVRTDDSQVGRKLFTQGKRGEFKVLRRAVKALTRLDTGRAVTGGTFVDVGANIGTTTVPALASFGFGRAVACEPDPENHALLAANLALNGLEGRSRALQVGVSNRSGTFQLALHGSNRGAHELVGEGNPVAEAAADFGGRIAVPVVTLNDLVRRRVIVPRQVALLWLDVQGHEAHVLEGASRLLARGVPTVVEFYPEALRRAGSYERMLALARARFSHVLDLRESRAASEPRAVMRPIAELEGIAHEVGDAHTDVLLVQLGGRRVRKRVRALARSVARRRP